MHSFVVRWECLISRNAWVPGLQQWPLFLGSGVGFQNMPAGSFCLKLPVKDNYFSTITFHTGTFDPFDMSKHTTRKCIFISFDPFDMSKHTTGICIFISFDSFDIQSV